MCDEESTYRKLYAHILLYLNWHYSVFSEISYELVSNVTFYT